MTPEFNSADTPDRYVLLSEGDGWLVWRIGLEGAFVSLNSWEESVAYIKTECAKSLAWHSWRNE